MIAVGMFVFLCMVVSGAVLIGKNPVDTSESTETNAKLRSTGIALVTIGSVLFVVSAIPLFLFLYFGPSRLRKVNVYTHNSRGRKRDDIIIRESSYD